MTYQQTIQLKNGAHCCLRSGTEADGQAALDNFILTHAETDHLLTYPDESTITAAEEGTYLKDKAETLPRKANEDAGLMARGILVNLGEMDIKNLHGPESYQLGLKLNHGRRPMVPLPN